MKQEVTATKVGLLPPHLAEGLSKTNQTILRLENMSQQKHFFIVPTDAHYYKIIEMLKQFKILALAPTRFGSHRNHHQGAILCLAKTTNMVFLCSSV
jgi:hypothetical protein